VFDNPFVENYHGSPQWGDLILPTFFNDYSMIGEGLYEFDKVIINENDVVFDCEANIGYFSAFVLAKGGILQAIEPINET